MQLWLIIVGPTLIFAMWAHFKVKKSFKKYAKVANSSGMSGAEAAAAAVQSLDLAPRDRTGTAVGGHRRRVGGAGES